MDANRGGRTGAARPGGTSVARGDVTLPVLTVFESAVDHNVGLMARYARERGFELSPHGKTTMAPAIFQRQLRAGAWAITVADVTQAKVAAAAGSPRVLTGPPCSGRELRGSRCTPGDHRSIAKVARDSIATMSAARTGGPGRADWR